MKCDDCDMCGIRTCPHARGNTLTGWLLMTLDETVDATAKSVAWLLWSGWMLAMVGISAAALSLPDPGRKRKEEDKK